MASTFAELAHDLIETAERAWEAIKAEAIDFEHRIVPVIEADIVAVLGQFKQLAIDTVLNFAKAEFDNLTGAEKHSNVVTTVFQAAEAAGKQVAIQDVRMFAQQAYDAVKATAASLQK